MPQNLKRQLSPEAVSTTTTSPARPNKRQKHEDHQTPGLFWDNLSRLWLTRRALREFNLRTSPASLLPKQPIRKTFDLARVKQFARHGGPSLCDLRSVSSTHLSRSGSLTPF